MDEAAVRERAEAHGQATVRGDLKAAGSDLDPGAYSAAGTVMKSMPEGLNGSSIEEVTSDGEECVVRIRYTGSGGEALVESRWADRDGTPKIVDLKVV